MKRSFVLISSNKMLRACSHISRQLSIIYRIKCYPLSLAFEASQSLTVWIFPPLTRDYIDLLFFWILLAFISISSWIELFISLHCLIRILYVFLACAINNQMLNPYISFVASGSAHIIGTQQIIINSSGLNEWICVLPQNIKKHKECS